MPNASPTRWKSLSPRPVFFAAALWWVAASSLPCQAQAAESSRTVAYKDGVLYVEATNTSLNSLIEEIARQTGMKISGRVAEDRVFGNYGPAAPQKVLAKLLDGTGSNLLILSTRADRPLELVLTPRQGAATPPGPPKAEEAEESEEEQPVSRPPRISTPLSRLPASPEAAPRAVNEAETPEKTNSDQVNFPPVAADSAPATGTTSTDSSDSNADSNAAKTPQQIFEQLQKLRQQSQPAASSTR